MGVIYKHPYMYLTVFNCNCLSKLWENISKEQNSIFLLGDFFVNLLNYNEPDHNNELLDCLAYALFMHLILKPTRITNRCKPHMDNIFSNIFEPDTLMGNLTVSISDKLSQFARILNVVRYLCIAKTD